MTAGKHLVSAEAIWSAAGCDRFGQEPIDICCEYRPARVAKAVFWCRFEVSADDVGDSDPYELPGFGVGSSRSAAAGVARNPSVGFGVGEIVSGDPSVGGSVAKSEEVGIAVGYVYRIAGVVFGVTW